MSGETFLHDARSRHDGPAPFVARLNRTWQPLSCVALSLPFRFIQPRTTWITLSFRICAWFDSTLPGAMAGALAALAALH